MKSLSWPGITVTLRVDGKDLVEYNEPDNDSADPNTGNTIVRFVEAVTDKTFLSKFSAKVTSTTG